MRIVLVGLVVLVGTSYADPAPPRLDDAVKQAAAAHKPLVVEFSASWCGPCKVFEKDVLGDSLVQKALERVVFVHYDAEVSPGLEAATKLDVAGYPTFVVVDKRGGVGAKNVGLLDNYRFISFVNDAQNHVEDEMDVRVRVQAHPKDPVERLSAAHWFDEHRLTVDAIGNYEAVVRNKTASAAAHQEATRRLEHLKRVDTWHHDLLNDKVAAIRADPAVATFDDVAIATVGSGLELSETKKLFATVFAAQSDRLRTNELVYLALAAGAKDEALAAAKRNLVQNRPANLLDTAAECFYVAGDIAQALQLEDEAIQQDPSAQLTRNRARFEGGSGEADEVIAARTRTEMLWKRLETADELPSAAGNPAGRSAAATQQMIDMRKSYEADRKVGEAIATACAKDAGKSEVAFARFELDPTNAPKLIDVLVDDVAPAKLRACVKRELGAASLLPRQTWPAGKRELKITFPKKR